MPISRWCPDPWDRDTGRKEPGPGGLPPSAAPPRGHGQGPEEPPRVRGRGSPPGPQRDSSGAPGGLRGIEGHRCSRPRGPPPSTCCPGAAPSRSPGGPCLRSRFQEMIFLPSTEKSPPRVQLRELLGFCSSPLSQCRNVVCVPWRGSGCVWCDGCCPRLHGLGLGGGRTWVQRPKGSWLGLSGAEGAAGTGHGFLPPAPHPLPAAILLGLIGIEAAVPAQKQCP